MGDKVSVSYETAKNILLDILQNNDFSADEDISRLVNSFMSNQKVGVEAVRLSRIKIDERNRIYFPEYSMEEVKMSYLPKTLFIFFLFHPDGYCFRHLCDFKQDLSRIYQIIAIDKNVDAFRIRKSIDNLTEPLNNRVYEACSIIRRTLSTVVPQEALEHYCIIGKRGEAHRVKLQRSLVCIENEELKKFVNY